MSADEIVDTLRELVLLAIHLISLPVRFVQTAWDVARMELP